MTIVCMQPAYLPWAGYFNLMSEADVFVYLDDAQLVRPSWNNRNRILVDGKPVWLTVAIEHTGAHRAINEATFDDTHPWRQRQLDAVRRAYAHAPFGVDAIGIVERAVASTSTTLADLDIEVIEDAAERLGLRATRVRSSELGITAKRTERLVELCRHFAADEYLSPAGARDYLIADRFTELTDVRLRFQTYVPQPYDQGGAFVSHLSIVDVVAQLGWERAASYIRQSAAGTLAS